MIAGGQLRSRGTEAIAVAARSSTACGRRAVNVGGWLFDAREFAPESCPADLDAIVSGLTNAHRACAALGSGYLPVVIPAKRNLVNVTASSDRGWMAELNGRLRDVDDVELMQLFGVLRHANRHGPPFHRTDADWNDLGAFFVARAVLKEARKRLPALTPPSLADLHLRPVAGYRGTLAELPKLELLHGELVSSEADVPAEDGLEIDASRLQALRMPVESELAQAGGSHARVYTVPGREDDSRVAVVGDSAAVPVVRWLAERSGRTTLFSSEALPFAQLELEAPRVVIHLMRETDLLSAALR